MFNGAGGFRVMPRVPSALTNMDEDEYRALLAERRWSQHAIDMEVAEFHEWKKKRGLAPPDVEKKEPITAVEKIAQLARRHRKGNVEEK